MAKATKTPRSRRKQTLRFLVGTSGYSYKEWKGDFYPLKLAQKEMLRFYAERFATVEINNSFRRMPSPSVLEAWTQQVPDSFRFVLKAPQTITHRKRLKEVAEPLQSFIEAAAVLGERRGPLLFQLPPNFKKDVARLEAFLNVLPADLPTAFEFRHASWMDDEVATMLRARSCALCVTDIDDENAELVSTASWGYVRLRREVYTDEQLTAWIDRIKAHAWTEAFVFFKHEDTGTGPKLANRFLELAGA